VNKDELDPRLEARLNALRQVPPRDPRRAAEGRAQFLQRAAEMKPDELPSQAVSFGLLARLRKWIQPKPNTRKEGLKMVNLLIAALMAVSVLFGGGAAAAYASQDALPGDALYPVKTVVEQAELTFTTDPVTKAELHLEFAQERVAEMQALAAEGQLDRIPDVAVNMQEHLQKAEAISRQLAQQGQSDAAARVAVMSQVAVQMLQQAMRQAPPEAHAVLEAAMRHAEQAEQEAMKDYAEAMQRMGEARDKGEQEAQRAQEQGRETRQQMQQAMDQVLFHLQGTVESMEGNTWVVDGQTVIVPDDARITGDVQVGDKVNIHGYVDPQGQQVVVQVVPLGEKQAENMPVRFVGTVDAIEDGTWTVNGQSVAVTDATEIQGDIQVGDIVRVKATVNSDGSLVAEEIKLVNAPHSTPEHRMVSFQGTVEAQNDGQWVVDGKTVNITEDTRLHGEAQVGDLVMVVAEPQEDGTFTARVVTVIAQGQPTMTPMPQPTAMPTMPWGGDHDGGNHEGGHNGQPTMTPMPQPTAMPTMPWGGDHDGGDHDGGNH